MVIKKWPLRIKFDFIPLFSFSTKTGEPDWKFKCDFCPNTFHTEDSFNEHTLGHFEGKNCLNCNKFLIRIGSEWYELHIDDHHVDEAVQKVDIIDLVPEVKIESLEDITEINDPIEFNTNSHFDDKPVLFDDSTSQSEDSDDSDEYDPKVQPKSNRKSKKKGQSNAKSREVGQPKIKRKLQQIKCRICERSFQKHNFENHLQKVHVPNVIVVKEKEKVNCEICGKTFASALSLKVHQTIHSGIRRFGMLKRCIFFPSIQMQSLLVFHFFSMQLLW